MWGILYAALSALLALMVAGRNVRGWRRMQRRNQVFLGDPNGLPESTTQPDATDVFDVAHEPLVLVWRMQQSSAGVLTFWLVVCGVMLVCSRWFPALASPTLIRLAIVAVAVLAAIITAVMVRLLRGGRPTSDQLTIVEAIGEGVRFQPLTGSVQMMRLEDMRLLEVEEQRSRRSGIDFATRFYGFYDRQQAVISWVEWSAKEVSVPQPADISWDEMWAVSRKLVDVIYQHTGLFPRTLMRSMQRGQAAVLEPLPVGDEETQEYPGTHTSYYLNLGPRRLWRRLGHQ